VCRRPCEGTTGEDYQLCGGEGFVFESGGVRFPFFTMSDFGVVGGWVAQVPAGTA
jgi:hypothetical protein